MGSLAIIGTFYERYENDPALVEALSYAPEGTELWVMCETWRDAYHFAEALVDAYPSNVDIRLVVLPTPRDGDHYAVIPYSHKINYALDRTDADYIVYLDNGSMPHPDKYRTMKDALDEHPDWGAVYCAQHRTGYSDAIHGANDLVRDAFCVLNYTQVMHRRTDDRWTLDMAHANPDLADAHFWRSLHVSLGPFYPVGDGAVLDTHHIPDAKAQGL